MFRTQRDIEEHLTVALWQRFGSVLLTPHRWSPNYNGLMVSFWLYDDAKVMQ